jgi:uncharacterized membrane protein
MLQKRFTQICILITALVVIPTAQAEYTENWEINSFHSNILLSESGTIKIKEKIEADFTNEEHRGILRSIPNDARLRLVNSTNEKFEEWDTKTYHSNGFLNIEATTHDDHQLTEKATFIFNYLAKNAINYFDNHDEFYWNVNGTDWAVSLNQVSASIYLPKPIKESRLKLDCFTGKQGATEKNCEIKIINERTIDIIATKPFEAYENLTIVIGLPQGSITPPSLFKKIIWYLTDHGIIFLPFITLLIMYLIWKKHGRDDQTVKNTIMPHYTPPEDMTPTETGVLIDEKLHPQDLTATIIDFAIKGYINIKEIAEKKIIGEKYDYELTLKKPYETTRKFEKQFMETIFTNNQKGETVKISDLKKTFPKNIRKIKKAIIKQMVKDDFFPHDPSKVRAIYYGIAFAVFFISNSFIFGLNSIVIGISAGIIAIFGRYMPRKTRKGTESYYHLRGLYEYIDTAEKDRMEFQEKENIIFEKLLPYAMAFGLISKWANAFKGLVKEPPQWYSSTNPNAFDLNYFAISMNKFNQNVVTTIAPKGKNGAWSGGSGFGGGGFSGGGFGGGGGRGL